MLTFFVHGIDLIVISFSPQGAVTCNSGFDEVISNMLLPSMTASRREGMNITEESCKLEAEEAKQLEKRPSAAGRKPGAWEKKS